MTDEVLTHAPDEGPDLGVEHSLLEAAPRGDILVSLTSTCLPLEAPDSIVALDGLEESSIVRVLGHDQRKEQTASDSDHTLDNKQPSPACDAVAAVESQAGGSDEASEGTTEHLEHEQGRKTLAELALGVPGTEEVDNAGEENGLRDTKEHTDDQETLVRLDSSSAGTDSSPDGGCTANVFDGKVRSVSAHLAILAQVG